MYKVIKHFTDLKDGNYSYDVGDDYPREGTHASTSRIAELAGSKNRQGVPLIKEVKVKASTKAKEVDKPTLTDEDENPKPRNGRKKKN